MAVEEERERERECRAMMDERILIGSQRRATMVVALPGQSSRQGEVNREGWMTREKGWRDRRYSRGHCGGSLPSCFVPFTFDYVHFRVNVHVRTCISAGKS